MATQIALIGELKVGKQSFLHRLRTGNFVKGIPEPIGVESTTLKIPMYYYEGGEIEIINIVASKLSQRDRKNIYKRTAAAMIMADLTRPETIERGKELIREYRAVNPNGIILFLLNKVDAVKFQGPIIKEEDGVITFGISVVTGFNLDLPGLFYRKLALFKKDPNHMFPNLPLANFVKKGRMAQDDISEADPDDLFR